MEAQGPVGKVGVEVADQPVGVFARDVAGGVAADLFILDADQVHPQRQVVVGELDAEAGGFEHPPPLGPLEEGAGVVAEHGEVGDGRPGQHPGGDRLHEPGAPLPRDPVHGRRAGGHQRGLPPEFRDGVVGHAVAEKDDVFHGR